ncbi:unnamed protein product [Prunus armeniaca]
MSATSATASGAVIRLAYTLGGFTAIDLVAKRASHESNAYALVRALHRGCAFSTATNSPLNRGGRRGEVSLLTLVMRYMKKGALRPTPKEQIYVDKPQRIPHRCSPPIRNIGRTTRRGHREICQWPTSRVENRRRFRGCLRREMDQVSSSQFTSEIEQAAPPKKFTTPSFTPFKRDSNLVSLLKHFKSAMILYKAEDVLMCKEYTSYRTIKKNHDHMFNLHKKHNESLQDNIKRFKAEKANVVGCDDRIVSSAFKKDLPTEHDLYYELTIAPNQTVAEVFAIAECYTLWDDDQFAAKSLPGRPINQQNRQDALAYENYNKFSIPIHQILSQVKDKPWVKKASPLKGDPAKRDIIRYCAFYELVREGHFTEFVAKKAI